jgi:hypothetical protein
MLETRIAQLEEKIRSASVVDPDEVDTEVVQVGNAVTSAFDDGKEQTFTIVGSAEAKPPARLSNESPIGKALLGHRKGDAIEVSLPNGLQAPPDRRPDLRRALGRRRRRRRAATRMSDPLLARPRPSSTRCARRGSTRSRTTSRASRPSPTVRAAHADLEPGAETDAATASPAACTPAAARARWPSWTSTTARGACSCRPAATCWGRRRWTACSSWTSATWSGSTASRSAPGAGS